MAAEQAPYRDPITNRVLRDPETKAARLDEVREEAIKLNFDYSAVFSTGVGQQVLDDLEAQFGGTPIVPGDPFMTHARAGSQEVLLYIRDRMRIPDNGG